MTTYVLRISQRQRYLIHRALADFTSNSLMNPDDREQLERITHDVLENLKPERTGVGGALGAPINDLTPSSARG